MSKKVNLATINHDFIATLSSYNVALSEIRKFSEVRNSELKKADAEEAKIRENRKLAIDNGMTVDEATAIYSLEKAITMRNTAIEAYNKAVEPHKKSQREAIAIVPDSIYYAYLLTIEKVNMNATGTVSIKKGSKVEVYKVENTFKTEICNFLEEIGVIGTDNDTALTKAAEALKTLTSGAVKSNKEGEYLKAKGKNAFKELFIRAFLEYAVNKRNSLVVNEDKTVSLRTYENK